MKYFKRSERGNLKLECFILIQGEIRQAGLESLGFDCDHKQTTLCLRLIIVDIRRTKSVRVMNKALKIASKNYILVGISQ